MRLGKQTGKHGHKLSSWPGQEGLSPDLTKQSKGLSTFVSRAGPYKQSWTCILLCCTLPSCVCWAPARHSWPENPLWRETFPLFPAAGRITSLKQDLLFLVNVGGHCTFSLYPFPQLLWSLLLTCTHSQDIKWPPAKPEAGRARLAEAARQGERNLCRPRRTPSFASPNTSIPRERPRQWQSPAEQVIDLQDRPKAKRDEKTCR